MMLKKPGLLLSSYDGLHHFYGFSSTSYNCSHDTCTTNPRPIQCTNKRKPLCRRLAHTDPGAKDLESSNHLKWPETTSATKIPTPYEIFKHKKGAPYSKQRFYELVKLYHPDKHAQDEQSSFASFLSQATKLERYRLIIAANDILSDPAKRNAYDRYGTGWAGRAELGIWTSDGKKARGRGWSGFDDNASPARNATWEDWEKWYERDAKGKQEPVYFSNGSFAFLIVIFAILGCIGEVTRVGQSSRSFIQQLEAVHDDSSKDLIRRRKESLGRENQDQRLQSFLRIRDPLCMGIDPRDDRPTELLFPPPREGGPQSGRGGNCD